VHVLDNPAWHALTGPHATVAERLGDAARYAPDVSVFSALPDEVLPETWEALRELVGAGNTAILARHALDAPDGWKTAFVAPCRQMWLPGTQPADPGAGGQRAAEQAFVPLGRHDVPEMLALVEATRPGPFATRTIELGNYFGARGERKELVAMAGERFHPPGFIEISAVCTDAAHRGRGLASQLVQLLVRGIGARDETPFLHLTMENETAHRVYAGLGFETRTVLDVMGVQAPK
jgi:ribosomal protein S18 acetylase RimI-like enzyme